LYKAGLRRIAAIHRGFSTYGDSKYRNVPRWQMALDLMLEFPDLELICDISHICGRRDILAETAQKAYDLNYDGLMVEVHPNPDQAWSDASQQITPERFGEMISALVRRQSTSADPGFQALIENFRQQIDEYDEEIIQLIAQRMQLVRDGLHCSRAVRNRNTLALEVAQHRERKIRRLTAAAGNDEVRLIKLSPLIDCRPAMLGIDHEIEFARLQHQQFDIERTRSFLEANDFRRFRYARAQVSIEK
ncbi:MAG: hypothetical protein ABL932_11770, partial [Terricaulis sp.]